MEETVALWIPGFLHQPRTCGHVSRLVIRGENPGERESGNRVNIQRTETFLNQNQFHSTIPFISFYLSSMDNYCPYIRSSGWREHDSISSPGGPGE